MKKNWPSCEPKIKYLQFAYHKHNHFRFTFKTQLKMNIKFSKHYLGKKMLQSSKKILIERFFFGKFFDRRGGRTFLFGFGLWQIGDFLYTFVVWLCYLSAIYLSTAHVKIQIKLTRKIHNQTTESRVYFPNNSVQTKLYDRVSSKNTYMILYIENFSWNYGIKK
jgi:hypothetical protein